MRKTGMLNAMKLCADYKKLSLERRGALQQERLKGIVQYARKKSPFYAEYYKDLPEVFTLSDLPPIKKHDMMARWNEWITDQDVKLSDVDAFMQNKDNIGRKLNGKYLVFTTSGSTGDPLVALYDRSANNMMGAISAMRAFARKEDLKAFMKNGGRTIGVFATSGFYLSNSSVRARQLSMPWKKRQMVVTSALLPAAEIVSQLNVFQPAMLGGYPSSLELLIDEAKEGRLQISPVIIMTGGEYLSDTLRTQLSDAFGCYVQTSYSCTEGGTVACECRERHFHINDDWLIVEPMDNDNHPVPDGVQSDKILLTNLYNYTQPFIRYEVSDRVILHREPCRCGNLSPWLELEGRTDDVVSFTQGDRTIRIAPLAIYAILKEVHEMRRFQLIVRPGNFARLRLEPEEGVSREEAFHKADRALRAFLAVQGVSEINLTLSGELPLRDPGSGKYKHIVHEM